MYHADAIVHCDQQRAWESLLDYQAWNPGLAGARVQRIAGRCGEEGEIVVIQAVAASGEPFPAFCAETVRLIAPHHLVWYVYPREGDQFRNFLHFALARAGQALQFDIYSYARDQLSGELLMQQRQASQASTRMLAGAFKTYCETRGGR